MTVRVFIGPLYLQAQPGPGGAGPLDPTASGLGGLAFDVATGDAIRDAEGNAIQIMGSTGLLAGDNVGSDLRERVETDYSAQFASITEIVDNLEFVWSDRDIA